MTIRRITLSEFVSNERPKYDTRTENMVTCLNSERAAAKDKVFRAACSALATPLHDENSTRQSWVAAVSVGVLVGTHGLAAMLVGGCAGWVLGSAIVPNLVSQKAFAKILPIAEASAAKAHPAIDTFFNQKIATLRAERENAFPAWAASAYARSSKPFPRKRKGF